MTGLEYVTEPNATAYEILKTVINEHPECVDITLAIDTIDADSMMSSPYSISGRFRIDFATWEKVMQEVRPPITPPKPVKPDMEIYDGT